MKNLLGVKRCDILKRKYKVSEHSIDYHLSLTQLSKCELGESVKFKEKSDPSCSTIFSCLPNSKSQERRNNSKRSLRIMSTSWSKLILNLVGLMYEYIKNKLPVISMEIYFYEVTNRFSSIYAVYTYLL